MNFLKDHNNSIILLVLLTVLICIITYYRVLVQIELGPVSDSFDFLSNALLFAGHGNGYSDLLRPPLFPFIISIFFRLGYVYSSTIFAVDGGIFIFGVIGMFLFLKLRFSSIESFLGGLLYSTFPVVLISLGFGFSDLVSVSFSIWALFFLVLGVENNRKFLYLAFPFAMFAFLSRYNSGLLIMPIFLYILINKDRIKFRDILIGIIVSVLTILPVLIFFYEKFGNILYPFINFGATSTGVNSETINIAYNTNQFYFIQRFYEFIGIQGCIILLIVVLGIFVLLSQRFFRKTNDKKIIYGFIKKIGANKVRLIVFCLVTLLFLISFVCTIYIVSELLFFILAYLFYDLSKNSNIKNLNIDIMVFVWVMAFFIFHSIFVMKTNRYFLTMVPSVAYFMVLGLSEISNRIKFNIRNRNITFKLITIILTTIILLSTATTIPQILQANSNINTLDNEIELSSQWFVGYDPEYRNKNIYSDLWPNYSWYLNTNVKMVPIYQTYKTLPNGNRVYSVNQADINAFNNYLINNNADYFFSDIPGLNLTTYSLIKQFDNIYIYQRKN
ncbi:glycosyltransferase family 39 protein [Methanobacterium sp. VT]|uniref:Glycosyltransferase family 39 protein n=1 Tax=Methanobacterium spitsbergense TaxID=2874285 RepID=A0A8T5UZD4_9EURY|nr:glycosyltransferase family 39 protein [Methanobacterium spitsbergense]MBZ2166163.1 glycosyltransferase family 39 protein [Methanobacterium spitsbergense]